MKRTLICTIVILFTMISCKTPSPEKETKADKFQYMIEQFADLKILRYKVSGFEELSLKEKELVYYLSQAAIEGRDIIFDQNYKYNLVVRRTLEAIWSGYTGDRTTSEFKAFEIYLKRVWFSNGIHHHYSTDKMNPGFSFDYFQTLLQGIDPSRLPLSPEETKESFIAKLKPVIFDINIDFKRVNQADGQDLVATSAGNYYEGAITQQEAEDFYQKMAVPGDSEPVSYGLNSTLVKNNDLLVEEVWKLGGKYSPAIEKIIYWLEKAITVTENEQQKQVISFLLDYYKTGDLKTFDKYNIAWLKDQSSRVDFVNGFIETYGDPLGIKASWESLVNFKNEEANHRTAVISANAQWFEDHSPVNPAYRKKEVKGVSAKVINAAMLGGDEYPSTAIGINLPNADWIRKEYGSKSVTIENITYAYHQAAQGNGFLEEFCYSDEEITRARKYGYQAGNLHTDLHECLGHGSGQLMPNTTGMELKSYGSAIEESRADLFALYYIGDEKIVELGLLPDNEAYKSEYDNFIRNGLMTQLTRIEPGKDIEESHMRNRQLIARWVYENGVNDKVIEFRNREGKTYVVINDYEKLRMLFGKLLAEIQRIKSEGDFTAARSLVETYGVKVDQTLHTEVIDRFKKLNIAPYSGFLNPDYKVTTDNSGKITDIIPDYSESFTSQMMRYSTQHSWLPTYN